MSDPPLLELRDLITELHQPGVGVARVVDHVSLTLERGETLGLVGESGCGKTMTALSILRLLPETARVVGGEVRLEGEDLLAAGEARLRAVRGGKVGMVFQEPMTALNPVLTVGEQVAEVLRAHLGLGRAAAWQRAIELLTRVGLPAASERASAYPHQLSGGLRQRALIAAALACDPVLLIADEPTTALDPTLQAQVLVLLAELRRERGMGLLLISHDLGVIAESCDRVAVLYAGQVVEEAPARALFASPRHPYTAALLGAARALAGGVPPGSALPELPGGVADPFHPAPGCRFAARCSRAAEACRAPVAQGGVAPHRYRCVRPLAEGEVRA